MQLECCLQRVHIREDVLILITVVPVAGTLPPFWGSHGCFADLVHLGIWSANVSGSLPPEWGMPASFQKRESLVISDCKITGQPHVRVPKVFLAA